MAHSNLPSEHDKSQEDGKEEGPKKTNFTTLQSARASFLKVISYFSGDMQVFGKWMKSKSRRFFFFFTMKQFDCDPDPHKENSALLYYK